MKQVHLKLLLCLLLAISATAQYNDPNPWGQVFQDKPYFNNWPYGRFGEPTNEPQYGVGYGQSNSASEMLQPTYNSQTGVEKNGVDRNSAPQEISSLISAPDASTLTAQNRGGESNSCYSVMDPVYPLFSLYCSALPQTKFSLPNFFGHKTKQEANELLTPFTTVMNGGCFRQMPQFLCPLFFPACSKQHILPCAEYCRYVKSRCREFDLAVINCDQLPEKSEFCPRIIEPNRFNSGTKDRYRNTLENEQSVVRNNYSDNSSSQSSVVQGSSITNAEQKQVNSDTSYGRVTSSAGSDFSATNIKPILVPKIILTTPEWSNFNQVRTNGGLQSTGNNNNYVAGSLDSNTKVSADSSAAAKNSNSVVESSEAKTIESSSASSSDINNNNVAGVSPTFGGNYNAAGGQYYGNNNYNAAGAQSYGNNNYNAAGASSASSRTNNALGKSSSSSTRNSNAANSAASAARHSYAFEQTGMPYGLQSTAEYLYLYPEKLDLSKCGPLPPKNPCTINGPQLYAISGYPQCYIQCAFGHMFVKPCPGDLVWNAIINVCDWSTVADSVDGNSYDSSHSSISNYRISNHVSRREKRAAGQHKKQPNQNNAFSSLKRLDVPLGPPAPGYTPVPGFSGPIGIAAPSVSPPATQQSVPLTGPMLFDPNIGKSFPQIFYPAVGSMQYPTLSYDTSRLIMQPALQPTAPQPVLSPPLPPPMPPPVYTQFPPMSKPVYTPPVMPNYYSPYNWPLPPTGYPMVPSQVMPQPTFPRHMIYPSMFPPVWPSPPTASPTPSLPKYPPFIPPIFPSVPIPLGGPLLPPLPMKIPATFFPGPPPIFSDSSYGPFDQYEIPTDGSSTGGQSVSAKGPEISFGTPSEYMDRSDPYANLDFASMQDNTDGSALDKNLRNLIKMFSTKNTKSNNDSKRKKRRVISDDDEDTLISVENKRASPCIGKAINVNVQHPTDSTKYISCLNENKYEIMNCPTSFIYNANDDKCEKIKIESICEQQPCMNNGECYSTSLTTFKCTCQGLWTGERCEIPLSSCASNPCGEGNQCHTLVTSDYQQDYVCICDKQQSYGLTCTYNTIPNPCMGVFNGQEQFYPFAFNSRAFVQCDGDLIHVRPCAPGLHWNQETKVCDRVESPSFIRPTGYKINQNTQSETMPNHPFTSGGYRYQDYYSGIPSNDLRYNTYQETPMNYPMFSPSPMIKGSRRLKHKQRLMSNQMHALPYDQDSIVSDQQNAQLSNQLPQTLPQQHLFRLFQSPSSYRR